MVLCFYVFHKNYHGATRERFAKVYTGVRNGAASAQLATLFQFDTLTVRDASCLASALSLLDAADRAHRKPAAGSRKGP